MADMIVQYRVMPKDGDVDYGTLESEVKKVVLSYGKNVEIKNVEPAPVGFGIEAVRIKFQMDENLGLENLEKQLMELDLVGELNVELMDRL